MILRVSQKLARKIKETPVDCLPVDSNPYADWSAHLFRMHRDQYIIFTNSRSLYSVLMYGAGITDINRFMEQMSFSLRELLTIEGASLIYNNHIIPALGRLSISKIGDKRLIGSMNDLIRIAKIFLDDPMLSFFDASIRLNETPMSLIKNNPRDAFLSMNL